MKKIYAAQPFEVGSKSGKSRSLALVIPHEVKTLWNKYVHGNNHQNRSHFQCDNAGNYL